jgi:Ser/Thr protein kinase RdoA (MazF antagonist)
LRASFTTRHGSGVTDDEVVLQGGVNAGEVVRIGGTVRRRSGPWTPVAHALLAHLEQQGFEGAPRVLGIDERGREVLSYADGVTIAPHAMDMLADDDTIFRLARLVGDFHRASASFEPPPDARWTFAPDPAGGPILLHNDLGAWNIVVDRGRFTIIDWDGVSPGRPNGTWR